jgi:hypothetical protein
LDRRLGGPQNRSGCCGENKNLAMAGNNLGHPVHSPLLYQYVTVILMRNEFGAITSMPLRYPTSSMLTDLVTCNYYTAN